MRLSVFFILLIICLFLSPDCYSWDWGFDKKEEKYFSKVENDNGSILKKMFVYYKKNISEKRGGICPMYPSCSRFMYESVNEYGFFVGFS